MRGREKEEMGTWLDRGSRTARASAFRQIVAGWARALTAGQ
jgi:hypothetical protein